MIIKYFVGWKHRKQWEYRQKSEKGKMGKLPLVNLLAVKVWERDEYSSREDFVALSLNTQILLH